jgi:hypothetical protein
VSGGWLRIDSFYTAEVGFVPRKGVNNLFLGANYTFYPQGKSLNTWGVGADWDGTFDLGLTESDRNVAMFLYLNYQDQSGMNVGVFHTYVYLFEDFDPTNQNQTGALPLPGMRGYYWNGFFADCRSSSVNDLQGNLSVSYGGYYNGTLFNTDGGVSYRVQPLGTFGLSYSYNNISLPEPQASADFWLLGPSAELAFSRKVFFSAFLQYNTQINNFNINTRLQWRFAPVSDLFLVYTGNQFAQMEPGTTVQFLSPKNRTLVLKVVYWLNV